MGAPKVSFDELTTARIDGILFSEEFEKPIKSDYAIVLGTVPEYAACRADIAASFYKKGGTRKLVVSGAAVTDKSVTECAVMRAELLDRGVPVEAVIEEPRAYDTIQNMTCSLTEICKRDDIMDVERITVITEPFHMKRALCLAKLLLPRFIKVYGYTEGVKQQREAWKTDERLNNCVRGEIAILKQLSRKNRIEDIDL